MAQSGLDRVAAVNKAIADQGNKGYSTAPNPMGGGNAVTSTSVGANPHDLPTYNPANDATTKVYDPTAATPNIQPTSTQPTTPTLPSNTPPVAGQTQATPQQVQQVADATSSVQNLSQQIGDRYKQGLSNVQASGTPAPATQGQASTAIQSSLGPAKYDTSAVEMHLNDEPVYAKILDSFADLMSPPKQTETLLSQYQSIMKASGINDINAELLNTKKIIDGTEDDIRAEVTAASGFATNSQVLALASARNKTLIQNYNNLLATKDSLMQQVNTSIQLAGQDRQYAQQRVDQQLQLGFKILEYRDKFQSNAKENYNNIVKAVGYQGLLQSAGGDPYQTSLIEKTLGLGSGGLAKLASTPKALTELEKADLAHTNAETANLYSQIKDRNNTGNTTGTITGKPQNATQASANGYADRLAQADVLIGSLGSSFTNSNAIGGSLPNFLQSGDRQTYEQAKKNFVTAVLRRESGASIAPTEFKTAEEQYFPQRGDKPAVLAEKEKLRNTVINNFYREANVNRPVLPGQVIESNGKKYKVDTDGITLKEI